MKRRWHTRRAVVITSLVTTGLLGLGITGFAQPAPNVDTPAAVPAAKPDSIAVPTDQRKTVLGEDWQHSTDHAWTTSGDADGFHLMVADAAQGFAWRTVATLRDPGVEADAWIGNACVTASGRRAVVAYAPRTFTNDSTLFSRGAATAIVDLITGAVTPLPVRSSLAYFSPSCGTGEQAVLTEENSDLGTTGLVKIDAAAGTADKPITVPGQLTSAVPTTAGIVAADSGALVRVDATGARRVVAATSGVPFRLAADADGGVDYLERDGANQVRVQRVGADTGKRQTATTLATGKLASVDVTTSHGGRVFVTGDAKPSGHAPSAVSLVTVPKGAQLSTQGSIALTSVLPTQADPRGANTSSPTQQVTINATVLGTGKHVEFAVTPTAMAVGGTPATRTPSAAPRTPNLIDDAHDPANFAVRTCSVPRNDPANQAMQPRPRQVEWAVDQAVRNSLTVQRPANWKNLAMPAYTPQGLFPNIPLTGGGTVPAQIMLGIAAQESNLWQAARFAVPGVTANPLIGNYFGLDLYGKNSSQDQWDIHWDESDCGYGVMQVTDGMRLAGHEKPGETALPYQTQRAVALDFAANVAAGLQILESKWNETQAAGLKLNNNDPSKIENWFFAVWDYNSGLHPNTGGPWGLGWANNPANPDYPANRAPFLDDTYQDAAHPQDWPYPEKVIGWAGHPVQVLDSPNNLVAGYRAAWWNGDTTTGPANRAAAQPPVNQFCDASDNCQPGAHYLPSAPDVVGEPAGPCANQNSAGQYDLHCWYHQASTWKSDCSYSCGNELLRFDPGYAYQDDGTAYPPTCDLSGLPAGAMIVDDVPDTAPVIRPDCPRNWSNAGSFTFTFLQDASGEYPGKIDTHQLGGGFGGHMWFTHTRTSTDTGGRLTVDGSWTLSQPHTGPMMVYVALPDIGGQTGDATYTVKTANGDRTRTVRQASDSNHWVALGTYMFNNVPEVDLTSVTPNGDGTQDIAFDAMAFVPVNGTYHEHTVEADAQFDENQNIDTPMPQATAGALADRQALYDWAQSHLSDFAALPDCPPGGKGACLTPAVKRAYQTWRDQVNAAGTDPVNHPANDSIADWIGFANPAQDRPTSGQRPAVFDDDGKYKIKIKATVAFVADQNGQVVPGSESATYEHRTGNTHIPEFVLNMIQAISDDYGIAPPILSYAMPDLNHHDGEWTTVDPYTDGGVLPGRAYVTAGKAPTIDGLTCVAAMANAGGSIGWRPMDSQSGPTNAFAAWTNVLAHDPDVSRAVYGLMSGVNGLFFTSGSPVGGGSLFNSAPPIWQELTFQVCADGTVKPVDSAVVLRSSYMPNQYLYYDGQAIGMDGKPTNSGAPVTTGDFYTFSGLTAAFGQCDTNTGHGGNPWNMGQLDDANTDPTSATFCAASSIPTDPDYSG